MKLVRRTGKKIVALTWLMAVFGLVGCTAPHVSSYSGFDASRFPGNAATTLTPREIAVATRLAHDTAARTIPGPKGPPLTGDDVPELVAGEWPTNIRRVVLISETRTGSGPFQSPVGADGTRRVVVIWMSGDLSQQHLGMTNANTWTRGGGITMVMDSASGEVTDGGIGPGRNPAVPKGGYVAFQANETLGAGAK